MIVVADSSPLQYLILLEQTALLQHFYGQVVVPDAVAAELRAARTPESVRVWMSRPPSWIEVVLVSADEVASVAAWLDAGERAAIALAGRLGAQLILIDEMEGRAEAARRRLPVTGTLGILRLAAVEGLIDVAEVLARLGATNFYADPHLIDTLFGRWLTGD